MISEKPARSLPGTDDALLQLEESERQLADFFNNAAVGLHWLAPDGTILRVNQAELDLLGFRREEYVGRNIAEFHVEPEIVADILRQLTRGEIVAGVEARMRSRDGAIRSVLISASAYRVDGRFVHTRGVTVDVTARRQAEERLRQSAKMEAIGQLAGGLAHDFNNQLHALSGLIDFVAMDPGLSEASQNDLAEIQNTTERMASLTRQLLAFSRQQVLVPETIDLNAAILETKPMLQRLVGSNLEMRLELAGDPAWVKVDRSQLLQVLMNLVINARDAMPQGGRLVLKTGVQEVRGGELDTVARGPVLPGRYARLTVQDSGTGIAREDLGRIFDAFFTTKPVGEGTGLGLATVDGILSQSRGHIWAESEGPGGATFHVLLPLTSEPAEARAVTVTSPTRARRRGRLLVVDDEAMVREVIVRTLTNHGYEVHQAVQGEDALDQLARLEGQVDLVVSDVVMPVMGGAELSVRLAERFPGMPIIWMSGYPRETVIGRGRLGEDQPFLQKPVPPALLLETVARVVRS
jgi:PAS domain S-box-containing protein